MSAAWKCPSDGIGLLRCVNLTLTYMFGKNGNNKPKPNKRQDNNGMDYDGEMMDF
mgnify:CR=1 FL=1